MMRRWTEYLKIAFIILISLSGEAAADECREESDDYFDASELNFNIIDFEVFSHLPITIEELLHSPACSGRINFVEIEEELRQSLPKSKTIKPDVHHDNYRLSICDNFNNCLAFTQGGIVGSSKLGKHWKVDRIEKSMLVKKIYSNCGWLAD